MKPMVIKQMLELRALDFNCQRKVWYCNAIATIVAMYTMWHLVSSDILQSIFEMFHCTGHWADTAAIVVQPHLVTGTSERKQNKTSRPSRHHTVKSASLHPFSRSQFEIMLHIPTTMTATGHCSSDSTAWTGSVCTLLSLLNDTKQTLSVRLSQDT